MKSISRLESENKHLRKMLDRMFDRSINPPVILDPSVEKENETIQKLKKRIRELQERIINLEVELYEG